MKRYNIYDVFPKAKKKCFYLTSHGSLIKIQREYIKVGTGYTQFMATTYSKIKKRWHMPTVYNEYQLVEQGKDWKQISEAEAFIEIL